MIIRLLLGDQLYEKHPWFDKVDDKVLYVQMELRQETDYCLHHIQKIIGFFGAMRNFKKKLEKKGHKVYYLNLDDPDNTQNLEKNLLYIFNKFQASFFEYQYPDEYRLAKQLSDICLKLSIPFTKVDTYHFMATHQEIKDYFTGKKQYVLEFFYRKMRKKFDILMEGEQPLGGKWNFDKSNRKKWNGSPKIPKVFSPSKKELNYLYEIIKKNKIKSLGKFDPENFIYPISREECLEQLEYFCKNLLIHFGDFQDALHTEELNLYHSRLSFGLNTKMISPLEVVEHVIEYYRKNKHEIGLSQVEGFVRQIVGWREYMRGIYWTQMPEYKKNNRLKNKNSLPKFYWNAKTKMNCLHNSVKNSLDNAYAHHIQRLMVLGNFALLAQVNPDEVDDWFLGIYADAIEWVQLPNTRGMSQWADGGIVATKPYVSSASYINKMGNYCENCSYDKKKRTGKSACPFNSLYWNFLEEKKEYFFKNNRMAMMLRLLEKIPSNELEEIKQRANLIISNPDAF